MNDSLQIMMLPTFFMCNIHVHVMCIASCDFYYTGGQVLIIQFPEKFPLPLWKAALAKRAKVEPLDNTVQYLQEVGFTVERGEEKCYCTVEKDKYFANLRHRVYTVLELFTTEEIKIGIKELRKTVTFLNMMKYML